jgi:hypothetical protein
LLTVGAAVYWCGALFGITLQGRTGNWLPLDAVNLIFVVPGGNLGNAFSSLRILRPVRNRGDRRQALRRVLRRVLPVLLGLALCIPLLAMVLPLLASADAGLFRRLLEDIWQAVAGWRLWRLLTEELTLIFWQAALGVPVAVWLCAYLTGAAHRRRVRRLDVRAASRRLGALRLAPPATVLVVLAAACATYLLFVGCQLPYFFSAFGGVMPGRYVLYSEYAREGFFELCRIATLNLTLLAAACLTYRREGAPPRALKIFNIMLSVLTLLIIATAFSKMGLYIARYGLTPRRIVTCVFMVFLGGVYLAVIALQFINFSIMRFAAVYGAGLLCLLCLCNLDGLVVRYNAARWQGGSLESFDVLLVELSGPAAAGTAMEIYNQMDGGAADEKQRLGWALYYVLLQARATEGTSRDSLANAAARACIRLPASAAPPGETADGRPFYATAARRPFTAKAVAPRPAATWRAASR